MANDFNSIKRNNDFKSIKRNKTNIPNEQKYLKNITFNKMEI